MWMAEALAVSGGSGLSGFVDSEHRSAVSHGTAVLWGLGVLQLSLLPREQFISFADS